MQKHFFIRAYTASTETDLQNIFLARQQWNEWIFCLDESHFDCIETGTAADDHGICAGRKLCMEARSYVCGGKR